MFAAKKNGFIQFCAGEIQSGRWPGWQPNDLRIANRTHVRCACVAQVHQDNVYYISIGFHFFFIFIFSGQYHRSLISTFSAFSLSGPTWDDQ